MSHGMLSDNEYKVLTSQDFKNTGIPEYKSRIIEKTEEMIETLRIIARSETVDQEFKDKVFPKVGLTGFINNLTRYDSNNTAQQESNKQAIVLDLLGQCILYFQDRYKEVFIRKEFKTFIQFSQDITEFTEKQIPSLQPPLLYPSETNWKAVCLECHKYYDYGKDEDEVIKKIRHTKNCTIHDEKKRLKKDKDGKKRIYYQYYKTIPPVKKPKKA